MKKLQVLTVQWSAEELAYTEFMQKYTTINSESYCDTFQKLKTHIPRMRFSSTTTALLYGVNVRPDCNNKNK